MLIEMKPVKFGDCFVLSDDSSHLIVDCGSANNQGKLAYSKIEDLVTKTPPNKLNLLITHFDADHYNGILEINNKVFDEIYFPYCFIVEKKFFCLTIAYLVLLAQNPNIANKKMSNGLVELLLKLPKILSSYGKLKALSSEQEIKLRTHKFDVVWPQCLEQFWPTEITLTQLESAQQQLQEYLLNIRNIDMEQNINNIISRFAESLDKFFSELHEAENRGLNNERIQQLIEPIESQYETLSRLSNNLNDNNSVEIINYLEIATPYLIDSMNACSIIFDNDDVVFFGDATKEIIKYLVQQKEIKESYKVVKIQHHGTRDYFTPLTPKAEYYLISNGLCSAIPIDQRFFNGNLAKTICCSCCRKNKPDYCVCFDNNKSCPPNCHCHDYCNISHHCCCKWPKIEI